MSGDQVHPTLYDILGLSPDASGDEVKRAWRDAADRFDPGSGGGSQFRLFNEAAEVLLDPERRRAYDARLAADDAARPAAAEAPALPSSPTRVTAAPSLVTILALATAFFVLVGFAAWGAAIPGLGLSAWHTVRAERGAAEAGRTAPSAAERAATAILSYNYKSLDTDQMSAERFMTEAYRKKYVDTFALVRENAPDLKADVVAHVSASGVSDASGDRADVLVFVNQTTTSTANREPQVALNRALFSMVKTDGTWLVSDITSY